MGVLRLMRAYTKREKVTHFPNPNPYPNPNPNSSPTP